MNIYNNNKKCVTLKSNRTVMKKSVVKFVKKSNNQNLLIKAIGGSGKTVTPTIALVKAGYTVLLACQSNVNVIEKSSHLATFKDLQVQPIISTSHQMSNHAQFPIKIKKGDSIHPWADGQMPSEKELVDQLISEYPQLDRQAATAHIRSIHATTPDFDNNSVVVCTQAMVQSMRRNDLIPEHVVIIVDDPIPSLVKNLVEIDKKTEKFVNSIINGSQVEIVFSRHFKRTKFMMKPETLKISYGLPNKFIWTTTETVLAELIKSDVDPEVLEFDDIPDEDGGEVVVIKSNLTVGKYQALIPLFVSEIARIQRKTENTKPLFVGNSVGAELNLSNVKGANDLTERTLVFKDSQPSAYEYRAICEQLNEKNPQIIKKALIKDNFEQGAFRNKGHRHSSTKSKKVHRAENIHVMTDQFSDAVVDESNLNIRYIDIKSLDIPRKFPESNDTVELLCWFIVHYKDYLCNEIDGISANGKSSQRAKNAIESVLRDTHPYSRYQVNATYIEILEGYYFKAEKQGFDNPKSLMNVRAEYLSKLILEVGRLPADLAYADKLEMAA